MNLTKDYNQKKSSFVSVNTLIKPKKRISLSVFPPSETNKSGALAGTAIGKSEAQEGYASATEVLGVALAPTTGLSKEETLELNPNQKVAPEEKSSDTEEPRVLHSNVISDMSYEVETKTNSKSQESVGKEPDQAETLSKTGKNFGNKSLEKQDIYPPMEKVTIRSREPGLILGELQNIPPTTAMAAYEQAGEASNKALEEQREEVQQSLPEIPVPTGLPTREGPPGKGRNQGFFSKIKPIAAFKSAKSGNKGKEYQGQTALSPAMPVRETHLASSERGNSFTDNSELSKNAQNALENISLDTRLINTSAGERPQVNLTGEADPSQIHSFQNESNKNVKQARTEVAQEIKGDFGENDIFPVSQTETLKTNRTLSPSKQISAGKDAEELTLAPEVAVGLDQSLGPVLAKRIGEQKEQYDIGKAQFDKDSAQARANADQQVLELNQATRKEQIAEQQKAKSEVTKYRQEWQTEQQKVEQTYQEKAAKASGEQRQKIESEQQKGEAKAAQHLTEAERKAEAEKLQAEQEAGQKKDDARKEAKGFWGWVKSAASALIDGLKKAIDFIYDNLRKAVKGYFELAKMLVKGVIELARQAIVGYIKAYGLILKGLVSLVFAAFPEIAKKVKAKIDQAVNAAVKAVNKAADLLKKGVTAVFDFLANTLDSLLGLVQSLYNGIFTVIGMIIRGEFTELMKRLNYLVVAAQAMPAKFETAAYEELLGGDLDEPLSPMELAQAGITPPGVEGNGRQTGDMGSLPGPPWSTDNVGVDRVENDLELSPELAGELLRLMGDKGEIEFGESQDKNRTMAAVMSEVTGEKSGSEPTSEKYPDDGLTPRQRAEIKWTLMKQGLATWWEQNKVKIISGSIAAIVGVIALIIVTGGAVFAAIPPIMAVLGPLFTGMTIAILAGHVRDYVAKSWDSDTNGGAKSLAKGLAAGAVELLSWLTFKAGEAAFKGIKVLAKGGLALAKGIGKQIVKGLKFIIEKGKVLFKGIVGSGIGRRLKSIAEFSKNLLERLRFKKFRIRFVSRRFVFEGYINPWVLLATGEIRYVDETLLKKRLKRQGRLEVGYKVETQEGIEGIVVGITKKSDDTAKRFVEEVLRPQSTDDLIRLYKEYDKIPKNRLKTMLELVSRETSENAAKLRTNMEELLGKKLNPGEHAHHIVPSTHSYKSAEEARKILKKYGIDINDAINGTALSGEIHSGLHTYKYMDEVLEILKEASTKDEVIAVLESIAKNIKHRNFP